MSERRRAEIEAKKAKLAELRKAREERQKHDNERKALEVSISIQTFSSLTFMFFTDAKL